MTVIVLAIYLAFMAAATVLAVRAFRSDMERLREWRVEHPLRCALALAVALLFTILNVRGVILEPGLKRLLVASSAAMSLVFVVLLGWLLVEPARHRG